MRDDDDDEEERDEEYDDEEQSTKRRTREATEPRQKPFLVFFFGQKIQDIDGQLKCCASVPLLQSGCPSVGGDWRVLIFGSALKSDTV